MRLPPSLHAPAIALLAWSAVLRNVAAQVTTDCFPMNTTCPPDPAFGMDYNFIFNQTPNIDVWQTKVGPVDWSADTGAAFTIRKQGDSPTIRSNFYFFWGRTEVWMKAARGTGIISSIMMLSDNLDEIDWEFIGGNETVAESNFFGKHIEDYHNAIYHPVAGGVQNDYHNYTTVWTKDLLEFHIDGARVRTLDPKDANNTYTYPQTPMRLSLGIWAGGDPRNPPGVRDWAGGTTDYTKGPFTMYVKSVRVSDFSSGKEYTYSDRSGSWQSIKITGGNSTVMDVMNTPPAKSLAEKWNDLPSTAKIAVYASAAGLGGILLIAALFYCIRQRRRGAREARAAEARAEAERLELERFKKAGVDPDSFVTSASEYNAKEMHREGISDKDSYSVPGSPAVTPASPLGGDRWESGAAALGGGAAAMRSTVPLLRDGAQSPPVASSGMPYSDQPPADARSPAPSYYSSSNNNNPHEGSRSPGPGGPASPRGAPPNRSFTSPNPQLRMGSPGPQQQRDFGAVLRSASPAQLAHPQPQRSFTAGGYGGGGGGGGAGDGGAGYAGNGGNQAYWGNGGGYR